MLVIIGLWRGEHTPDIVKLYLYPLQRCRQTSKGNQAHREGNGIWACARTSDCTWGAGSCTITTIWAYKIRGKGRVAVWDVARSPSYSAARQLQGACDTHANVAGCKCKWAGAASGYGWQGRQPSRCATYIMFGLAHAYTFGLLSLKAMTQVMRKRAYLPQKMATGWSSEDLLRCLESKVPFFSIVFSQTGSSWPTRLWQKGTWQEISRNSLTS